MNSTRRDLLGTAILGAAGLATLSGPAAAMQRRSIVAQKPRLAPQNLTADEALALLEKGNADFLSGNVPDLPMGASRRFALAEEQRPIAAYVSCSDSRVPPELLFGRGLGELVIIRNGGNTVDGVALGSIEYAVDVLKVPLVVIMGHENCTAVTAAVQAVEEGATFPGSIEQMIEPIIPAVLTARQQDGDLIDNSVHENVRRTVRHLRNDVDPILLDPQREGRLKVVGAYYDLVKGSVDFFDKP